MLGDYIYDQELLQPFLTIPTARRIQSWLSGPSPWGQTNRRTWYAVRREYSLSRDSLGKCLCPVSNYFSHGDWKLCPWGTQLGTLVWNARQGAVALLGWFFPLSNFRDIFMRYFWKKKKFPLCGNLLWQIICKHKKKHLFWTQILELLIGL